MPFVEGVDVREYEMKFRADLYSKVRSGEKTQSRRIVRPQPPSGEMERAGDHRDLQGRRFANHFVEVGGGYEAKFWSSPYGIEGDRLRLTDGVTLAPVMAVVENVWAEPLQAISDDDVEAEGMPSRERFFAVWDELFRDGPPGELVAGNPYVFCYEWRKL